MPRKYERPRLTARDQELIKWVAEQQVVRFDTLLEVVKLKFNPISKSDLYALCDRWYRMGYVRKERLIGSAPMIIWATRLAIRLSELPLNEMEKFGKPNFTTLHHNCSVSVVRLEYEKNGYKWICERRLRHEFSFNHLPDGIAENDEFRIIVEVDISQKESRRLQDIMTMNAQIKGATCVDYWTNNTIYPVVLSNAKQITRGLSERVRVFKLPAVVNS